MDSHSNHSQTGAIFRAGFSLFEVTIILIVVSIMLAGLLPFVQQRQHSDRIQETINRFNLVDKAMQLYIIENRRAPCPADITLSETNSSFGIELPTPGTCTGANWGPAANTIGGMVPTRALNLPDEYAYDGWGRRLVYHIDQRLTEESTYMTSVDGSINLRDINGDLMPHPSNVDNYAYILLSHGENGHVAYTIAGNRHNEGSTNTHEHANCSCDASLGAITYDNEFYRHMHTLEDTSDPKSYYDDVIRANLRQVMPY